jgi:hypothetical protein
MLPIGGRVAAGSAERKAITGKFHGTDYSDGLTAH